PPVPSTTLFRSQSTERKGLHVHDRQSQITSQRTYPHIHPAVHICIQKSGGNGGGDGSSGLPGRKRADKLPCTGLAVQRYSRHNHDDPVRNRPVHDQTIRSITDEIFSKSEL